MREISSHGYVIEPTRFDIGHHIGEHVRAVHEPAAAAPGQVAEHALVEQRPPVGALQRGEVGIGKLRDVEAVGVADVARVACVALVRGVDGYRSAGTG